MDCKTVENLYGDFVENRLDDNSLGKFIFHVENCSSCREELYSQYPVLSALYQIDNNLEFSEDYDLELENRFASYKMKKKRVINRYILLYFASLAAAFIFTLIISLFIFTKDEIEYLDKDEKSTFTFEISGFGDSLDPIDIDIKKYNKEIIKYIHSSGGNND